MIARIGSIASLCAVVVVGACGGGEEPEAAHANTVDYRCDNGHRITARYAFADEAAHPDGARGDAPPASPASVEVSIDGASPIAMKQTISADGIRFATPDESLVFWSKGNTALVMRHNAMDLNYTNCADASTSRATSE